ncbi:MAG TPA: hypothetical protein VGQ83_06680 [Polyangia bacterium]|jgi:hypothetical protein
MHSVCPTRRQLGPVPHTAPRLRGNALFTRCQEELENYLEPTCADEVLRLALEEAGTTPDGATIGHLVRAADLTLPRVLAGRCPPEEADAVVAAVAAMLEGLTRQFFCA